MKYPPSALDQVDHAEVDIRAESTVQPHLFVAVLGPPLEGREVEEPEVDRFLDLVGESAGQHDPRDVRLEESEVGAGCRIGARPEQCADVSGGSVTCGCMRPRETSVHGCVGTREGTVPVQVFALAGSPAVGQPRLAPLYSLRWSLLASLRRVNRA